MAVKQVFLLYYSEFITITFITARKRSLQKLCFHKCLSVDGGVYLWSWGLSATPPGQTPPKQIPLGRHPPDRHLPGRHPQTDTPLPSACWDTHPPAQCMLGYTPSSACWNTVNKRAVSHWNAFLYI